MNNEEEVKDLYIQMTCRNKSTRRLYYVFAHGVRRDKWFDGATGYIKNNKKYLYICAIQTDAYGHLHTAPLKRYWIHDIIDEIEITSEQFDAVYNKHLVYCETIDRYECDLKSDMDKKIKAKCKELQKENKVKIIHK